MKNHLNMPATSRWVVSNQQGVHPQLLDILRKHTAEEYRKPISRHTVAAFEDIAQRVESFPGPLILDSACGTGESTTRLAAMFPGALVLGIDKSAHRLARGFAHREGLPENMLLLRADYFDFWRMAARAGWRVQKHFLLYPNPWPKKRHLMRRIHGHPAFFDLLRISGHLELRSNWRIYLDEFATACQFALGRRPAVQRFVPGEPMTAFERKYHASGHALYRLVLENLQPAEPPDGYGY